MTAVVRPLPRKFALPSAQSMARFVGTLLLRIVAAVVVMLTALPVLLLLVGTAVPIVITLALLAADLVLIAVLLRPPRTPLRIAQFTAGLVALSVAAIVASQWFAATPPIAGAHSIATLEKVNLNGSEQWITIRGQDVDNPLLLFLAGGPGASQLFVSRVALAGLEDHFVVVNWDQPGVGKSYDAGPIASLTPQRFVADAHALVLWLRERFQQEKIYVLGESWGTDLGILLVQHDPDLFYAYIGAGQDVRPRQNERMGYEFALKLAAERGDSATVETLRRNGPPPYSGDGLFAKYFAYTGVLNTYMEAHAQAHVGLIDFARAPEYGLLDRLNYFRSLSDVATVMQPQIEDIDFTTQAARLDVPVYFLVGRWDVNEMPLLVEQYYAVLQAPHKELIWFDQSGHTPIEYEPGKVVDAIVRRVLPETYPRPAFAAHRLAPGTTPRASGEHLLIGAARLSSP